MKRIILIVLLVLIELGASAQRFDAKVFAGLNLCQIDGDDAGKYNHP